MQNNPRWGTKNNNLREQSVRFIGRIFYYIRKTERATNCAKLRNNGVSNKSQKQISPSAGDIVGELFKLDKDVIIEVLLPLFLKNRKNSSTLGNWFKSKNLELRYEAMQERERTGTHA